MKRSRGQAAIRLSTAAVFLLTLLAGGTVPAGAEPPGDEPTLGPLGGRNIHAPHLPWFSFPAGKAAAREPGEFLVRSGLYYLNEFSCYDFEDGGMPLDDDGRLSDEDQQNITAMDYESTIWEVGAEWQATARWRFSVDWRLHARYGGFLDGFIEGWHSLLGVPNAGREFFDRGTSLWNVRGSNITDFSGSGTVFASGDIDLGACFTILDNPKFALAGNAAFKLPTGARDTGFGSGYPDLGFAAAVDWRPWKWLAFYGNLGMIIPLGPNGRLMGQFIPAIEFRASRNLSILLQMNLQTSPVIAYPADDFVHNLFGTTGMFELMQTNLKVGIRGRSGRFEWQLFFEEDPLTWEGADIVVFFGGGWVFGGD